MTSKIPRLYKTIKKIQIKYSEIKRLAVRKLNQIKFDLEKQRTKDKEKKQTELRKTQNNDVMEKYRKEKDFTNDACNEHDKKTHKNALY